MFSRFGLSDSQGQFKVIMNVVIYLFFQAGIGTLYHQTVLAPIYYVTYSYYYYKVSYYLRKNTSHYYIVVIPTIIKFVYTYIIV